MDINRLEGLSSREVAARQKKFGYNELPNRDKKSILKMILDLLSEPMILMLLATVVIYFILGDPGEAALLGCSFIGIAAIELYQESKTEKSLEALRNLSSPICDVIRDGKRQTIPGREVVVGDIIFIAEGSRVPADATLITSENLQVNESLLTGESMSVEKHTHNIKDYRTNSVFSGTLVVKGHAMAEVVQIGQATEMGKIGATLKDIKVEKTLLQKEVTGVIKFVAIMAVLASLFLAIIYWINTGSLIHGLLAGLTLAIGILPEEFPVVLTIFLTLGAWRLTKVHILARRSHTIETLGSASVLCVDKTGTLTENQMEIAGIINPRGDLYEHEFDKTREIIRYGVLASQKNPFDPMEEAFIIAGKNVFGNDYDLYDGMNIIREYPLEENLLCVVHAWGKHEKPVLIAAKGAPETIFDLCDMSPDYRQQREADVKVLASRGLRVLAIAKAHLVEKMPQDRRKLEYDFIGLVGLVDPIRSEVPSAVKLCKQAGVRVVMITGDFSETAANIAKQIGLDEKYVITGAEFEAMSDEKKKIAIKQVSVFSRVTPSNKYIIVNAFKQMGEVVAMTGDGVNDAPALKSAHVGIAMGKKGTDVAREASSIVLLDDNFASIVDGIRLGRRIYDNLQKAMSYIIAVHIPIALLALIPAILKWPTVLIPAHIVFLEFIIDPSCTIIFENEKESRNIMNRPPRKLTQSIFNKKMLILSLAKGLIVAAFVLISYRLMLNFGCSEEKARGLTFLALVMSNLFLILGISGRQALADFIHKENMPMVLTVAITSISLIFIFSSPILRDLFDFAPITLTEGLLAVSIGLMSILVIYPIKKIAKEFI